MSLPNYNELRLILIIRIELSSIEKEVRIFMERTEELLRFTKTYKKIGATSVQECAKVLVSTLHQKYSHNKNFLAITLHSNYDKLFYSYSQM